MYRRQLIGLYAVLIITMFLLAWRFVSEWKSANLRYGALARSRSKPASIYLSPAPPPQPSPAVGDIVTKNLFSADRNNDIVQDQKAAAPPPPVPIVFGTMNLGGSYEALMAEGGSQRGRPAFRRVKKGESISEYRVVEIEDEKVVVEFRGEKTTIDVYQSARTVPQIEARSAPVAAPPVVESGGAPVPQSAPTVQTSASAAGAASTAQSQTDPGIRVTIEGNRRRMERQTPFGPQVWYENIPKGQ